MLSGKIFGKKKGKKGVNRGKQGKISRSVFYLPNFGHFTASGVVSQSSLHQARRHLRLLRLRIGTKLPLCIEEVETRERCK